MKKVTIFTDPKDPYCTEIEKLLKGLEINLVIHDMRTNPLSTAQLSNLLRSFDLEHFINPSSRSRKTNDLDTLHKKRRQILELIAEDNGFLRRPIVVCGRLLTVGYDRRRILEMLQMTADEQASGQQAGSAA